MSEAKVQHRFCVDFSDFERRVEFRLNVSRAEMAKEISKSGCAMPDLSSGSAAFTLDRISGDTVNYVWMQDFGNDLQSLEALANEILRTSADMLSGVGARAAAEADGAFGASSREIEAFHLRLSGGLFMKALVASRLKE